MAQHVTMAECMAALPHVLDAPKAGKVETLCFRPDYLQREYPETLEVTVEGGIKDERWLKAPWLTLEDGAPDPRIQVSILPQRVMDLCWLDREGSPHPGDTIVTDMDLSEANLPVGTRLKVGTAVLEVSDKFNNGCIKWRDRYGAESLHWLNKKEHRPMRLRGVLCKIVQDGELRLGAPIEVLRAE